MCFAHGVLADGGVPAFVFNGKYAISGAQPVEQLVAVLKKAQAS